MKTALKLKLPDGRIVVFTVHELLQLAQSVMQSKFETCGAAREMKSIHYGDHFHPQKLLSTSDWLTASKKLEQGATKEMQTQAQSDSTAYRGEQWLALVEYYRAKIDVDELNRPPRPESEKVWIHAHAAISAAVQALPAKFKIEKNMTDYGFVNLNTVSEKPTVVAVIKTKPKIRSRGFYLYELAGTYFCLIVHSKNESDDIALDQAPRIVELLKKLSDSKSYRNEKRFIRYELEVREYFESQKVRFSLTHVDLKYTLMGVNSYLLELKYSLALPEKSDFLQLFQQVYFERCQKDADSECLTHLRCIIDDLLTLPILTAWYQQLIFANFPEFPARVDDQRRLAIYFQLLTAADKEDPRSWDQARFSSALSEVLAQEIPEVSVKDASFLFNRYCERHRLALYEDASSAIKMNTHLQKLFQLCEIQSLCESSQISHRQIAYFLACLRSANHKGWTRELVESEVSRDLEELKSKSEAYENACFKKSVYHLLNKRFDLFAQFNAMQFTRELSRQLNLSNFVVNAPSALGRLIQYSEALAIILPDTEKGFSNYYTLLRLFCRAGEKFTPDDKGELLDYLEHHKDQPISCSDMCVTSNRVKSGVEKRTLSISQPSIEFFVIGDRVIGINHNDPNKPLYVYDYGSTTETFALRYHEIQQFSQCCLDEFSQLKIGQNHHATYLNLVMQWYGKLLTRPEIQKISGKNHHFLDTEVQYVDINKIEGILRSRAQTFKDESLRIQHIEAMMINYIIRGLSMDLELTVLYSTSVSQLPKDTSVVTYPQICRQLPADRDAQSLANLMRNCLDGKVDVIKASDRPVAILTATWFLAETGRNPQTFLISLMLLDLIEANIPYNSNGLAAKYYNWRDLVWNSSILNNALTPAEREQQFPQEEGWGGKHAMCHGGSYARLFKAERFPAIEASLGQVRQKEGTILINWLSHAIQEIRPDIEVTVTTLHGKSKPSQTLGQKCTFFTYEVNEGVTTQSQEKTEIIETVLKPLISRRLENFERGLASPLQPSVHTKTF